jgi:circadian clock protein KaiC
MEGGRNGGSNRQTLAKSPTGIKGLDEITEGGLPRGRSTLVTGGPGCGKTLLGMEYLVRGARDYGETGVFMAFEENVEELTENMRSLGFDLAEMIRRKQKSDLSRERMHELLQTARRAMGSGTDVLR